LVRAGNRALPYLQQPGEAPGCDRSSRVALLRGLIIDDLFDIVARHGLHFDPVRQEGVVFHMISCLTEFGRIGLTAVGDTPTSAKAMYQKAERILLEEARESLAERPLPA
jgi:hypothetical protein